MLIFYFIAMPAFPFAIAIVGMHGFWGAKKHRIDLVMVSVFDLLFSGVRGAF
jgi:hypothetical protein